MKIIVDMMGGDNAPLAVLEGTAREYVQYLKDEIKRQEESNQLKIDYMKKLKNGR